MVEPQVTTAASPSVELRSKTQASHLLTGALCVGLMALFLSFIFNRYLPINEGWFQYYSWMMHSGKVPYRDFWFFGPPVSLIWTYLFSGDHILNLRIFGLLIRILLTGMMYFLLSRQFSPRASFLATIVSMAIFLSYISESFFTYLVDSFLFLVAGLICVSEAQVHPRRQSLIVFLAGVCGSLSFFTKQSSGLFATFALVVLLVWLSNRLARAVWDLVYFSIGWCVTAIPFVSWLVLSGAWRPFIEQVFVGAAASKGTARTLIVTTLHRSMPPLAFLVFFCLFGLFALALWRKRLIITGRQNTGSTVATVALIAVLTLVVLFTPFFLHASGSAVARMRWYVTLLAQVTFMAMGVALLWQVARRLRSQTPTEERIAPILVVAGFLWAYGCLMSYMVEQHAIILGVAYFVAVACDSWYFPSGKSFAGIVTVLCLLQLGEIAWYKFDDAYDWHGTHLEVSRSPVSSHWPQLAGFRVDKETVDVLDTVLDDIAKYAKPGEPIFTYPHIPLFNVVTRHPQPTFAPVHYWDVCPDYLAEADALRVKAAKPAVIVVMDMPEWLWLDGEETFRRKKRSGQRSIQAVIDDFAASGEYRLVHSLRTPGGQLPLDVWARIR